jgi:hypothetical protein
MFVGRARDYSRASVIDKERPYSQAGKLSRDKRSGEGKAMYTFSAF